MLDDLKISTIGILISALCLSIVSFTVYHSERNIEGSKSFRLL